MKQIFTLIIICIVNILNAQIISDFENIAVPENSYIKNAGPEGAFSSGAMALPNMYTDAGSFDFWEGWVISNVMDTLTPGFTNEGASWAGSGYLSTNYAVCYSISAVTLKLMSGYTSSIIEGMYVSNSSYAALAMRDGDSFAKKFGGETGNDPDYFYISIKKWLNGTLSPDSLNFYLADYRFTDNSDDYILKDWTWLELKSLGEVDSLRIEFFSSDTGSFGINTPTYLCVDDITVRLPLSESDQAVNSNNMLYPNPANDRLFVKGYHSGEYQILGLDGRTIKSGIYQGDHIDVSWLDKGSYILILNVNQKTLSHRFIKMDW